MKFTRNLMFLMIIFTFLGFNKVGAYDIGTVQFAYTEAVETTVTETSILYELNFVIDETYDSLIYGLHTTIGSSGNTDDFLFIMPLDVSQGWYYYNGNSIVTFEDIGAVYVEYDTTITNADITILNSEMESIYSIGMETLTNAKFYASVDLTDVSTYLEGLTDGRILGRDDIINNGATRYEYSYTEMYDYDYIHTLGYDDGYIDGQDDMFNNGSDEYLYTESDSYDYLQGVSDLFHNGASSLDMGLLYTNSFDYDSAYDDGYDEGALLDVNSSIVTFNEGFENWIVPVVVVVIFLGGFFSIIAMKRKQ